MGFNHCIIDKMLSFAAFQLFLAPYLRFSRVPGTLLLSGGCKYRISRQIVGHVPQADFGPDANEADSTCDGTACSHRHYPKDMFNPAAHPRSASVAALLSGTQFLMPTALALNVLAKVLVGKRLQRILGTIGGICIDVFVRIFRIKQLGKDLAVMDARISHFITADKFVSNINAEVILLAEERFAVFLRPAGIGVFLPPLCLRP
jgi:hypothetical protein